MERSPEGSGPCRDRPRSEQRLTAGHVASEQLRHSTKPSLASTQTSARTEEIRTMSGYRDGKTPRDSRLNPRACTCLPGKDSPLPQSRGGARHRQGARAGPGEGPVPHEAGAPWPRPRRRSLAEGRPGSLFSLSRSQNSEDANRDSDFPSPAAASHWSTPGTNKSLWLCEDPGTCSKDRIDRSVRNCTFRSSAQGSESSEI
ncbi:uncharacterized protein LOC128811603 isoform X2 [Vidua macroura]|uniref:uncharacterized protein LOC128811603 isoform X2 n=1 Tax=Vidua macroura TaxID=187451 RepID=UPI0023A84D33|nr:uncharacterized protein LOC128811603 isoform X2 [Vidua macroura]